MQTPRLVLYFTEGVSLATWHGGGNLDRETALYLRLAQRGYPVDFVTYGGSQDLAYGLDRRGIRVHCNRWRLPESWYRLLITRVCPRLWRGAVCKSNQLLGADAAREAARTCGGIFVARCGYLEGFTQERLQGADSAEARAARRREHATLCAADHVVLTTERMKREVLARYPLCEAKISIIPNYVDCRRFAPAERVEAGPPQLIYVGRLAREKNLAALIQAVSSLDVEVVLVGSGPLERTLRQQADRCGVRAAFAGSVPHARLPQYLAHATVFVLPSLFEGHPKALLEAMACGLPVLGTRVPGIEDVISHEIDGLLCDPTPEGLRAAIDRLLGDGSLRKRLGRQARQTVLDRYCLDGVVQLEESLLRRLTSRIGAFEGMPA